MMGSRVTIEEARGVGEQTGIDWASAAFDVDQFRAGMEVEPEHGSQDPATDVTYDDPDADNHYLDTGVRVLDLAERARELYLRQDEANRRRLLGFVLAECTLQAGRLRPTWLSGPHDRRHRAGVDGSEQQQVRQLHSPHEVRCQLGTRVQTESFSLAVSERRQP